MGKKVGRWLIVMTELLFMTMKAITMDILIVMDTFLKMSFTAMTDIIAIGTEYKAGGFLIIDTIYRLIIDIMVFVNDY